MRFIKVTKSAFTTNIGRSEYLISSDIVTGNNLEEAIVEYCCAVDGNSPTAVEEIIDDVFLDNGALVLEIPHFRKSASQKRIDASVGGEIYRASFIDVDKTITELKNEIIGLVDTNDDAEIVKMAMRLDIDLKKEEGQ